MTRGNQDAQVAATSLANILGTKSVNMREIGYDPYRLIELKEAAERN